MREKTYLRGFNQVGLGDSNELVEEVENGGLKPHTALTFITTGLVPIGNLLL